MHDVIVLKNLCFRPSTCKRKSGVFEKMRFRGHFHRKRVDGGSKRRKNLRFQSKTYTCGRGLIFWFLENTYWMGHWSSLDSTSFNWDKIIILLSRLVQCFFVTITLTPVMYTHCKWNRSSLVLLPVHNGTNFSPWVQISRKYIYWLDWGSQIRSKHIVL